MIFKNATFYGCFVSKVALYPRKENNITKKARIYYFNVVDGVYGEFTAYIPALKFYAKWKNFAELCFGSVSYVLVNVALRGRSG